jgi:hypothetical protein
LNAFVIATVDGTFEELLVTTVLVLPKARRFSTTVDLKN